MNRLAALAVLALAAVSVVRYESDRRDRGVMERFVTKFDVAARRPKEAETLPLFAAADLGTIVTTDVALGDALGTVHLANASPEARARWLTAMEHVDDELAAARDIALDSIAVRPGWAGHWVALGELQYAIERRAGDAATSARWRTPLRIGLSDFPGSDSAAAFAATADLEQWSGLDAPERTRAMSEVRRALLDPSFAASAFPLLASALGGDTAVALLPSNPETLRIAFDAVVRSGDAARAPSLYARWESAEWAAREADLRQLEERARSNDLDRQRDLADHWLAVHRATDFDTDAGRDQVLRVLQLAVNDRIGPWQSDPRAAAVRFLLNRRIHPSASGGQGLEIAPGGAVIESVVDSLAGVPAPVRARAHLLGGDVEGAQAMYERSDSAGSSEWTPFVLDLAQYRLAQSSADGANAALATLAPATRNECDAALMRRKVAQFDGTAKSDPIPQSTTLPATAWSDTGVLALCIDPEAAALQQLATTIESPAPALLMWGWNDGRHGAFSVDAGRTTFRVPLAGRSGRQFFFIRSLTGTRVTLGAATVAPR